MPVGKVRDAHGGIRHVDVLAARAAGAERVDAEIVQLDIDLDLVVDLREDEYGRERGVTPRGRIERRDAHQAMHADLRLQHAISIGAVDFERGGLDAGAFAFETVGQHGLEIVAFGPAQVHAQQHLGPVLRFGAAGAGMDGDDGVARVVFAREQHPGFEFAEHFGVALQFALDIAVDGFAFAGEFEKRIEIVGHAGDLLVVLDGFFETLAVLHDLLAFFGLGPEVGSRDLLFGAG